MLPTIIQVYDGTAEVVQSTVPVEIMDFDVTPGADEEWCTCGDHDSENQPHGHTITEPTKVLPIGDIPGVLGRLLVTEDDYDSGPECHWCQSDPHTDGCPGVEARSLLRQLSATQAV